MALPFGEKPAGKLLQYHKDNLGVSRFDKFKYLYENILKTDYVQTDVDRLSRQFSEFATKRLMTKEILIMETVEFIQKHVHDKKMFIVSSSEEKELNMICKSLEINQFFESILGSPATKVDNINSLISHYSINRDEALMIGDSEHDAIAAMQCGIRFAGYNNTELCRKYRCIKSFSELNTMEEL